MACARLVLVVLVAGLTGACSSVDSGEPVDRPGGEAGELSGTVAGTTEAVCVDVDDLREQGAWREVEGPDGSTGRILDVRSGQITAGNFFELIGAGTPGEPDFVVKIYWVPANRDVAETEPLTVTVEAIDDSDREPVVVQVGGDADSSDAGSAAFGGGGYFWASGIPLPALGRWRLTAEALDHWGCFELTLAA